MLESLLLKKKSLAAGGGTTFSSTYRSVNTTLSNNNKTANMASTGAAAFSNTQHSSGKWYFEALIVQSEGSYTPLIGIASQNTTFNDPFTSSGELMWYGSGNQIIWGANNRATYGTFTTGDVISFTCDLDGKLMVFYKNGAAMTGINLNAYLPGVSAFWAAASSPHGSISSSIVKIPDAFQYMPGGYSAW